MRDPRSEVPYRLGDSCIPPALLIWLGFHSGNWLVPSLILGGAFVLNFLEWLFYRRMAKPRPGSGGVK